MRTSPLPSWAALHPLMIHFPIALLLVAPIFVLAGVVMRPGRGCRFMYCALISMAIGTAALFFVSERDEAAARAADNDPQIRLGIKHYEELAEAAKVTFTALTAIFSVIVLTPRILRTAPSPAISVALPLTFLLLYAAGAVILATTARGGGRLAYNPGMHANRGQSAAVIAK